MKKIILFIKISWNVSIKYYIMLFLSCITSLIQMLLDLYLPALFVESIITNFSIVRSAKYLSIILASKVIFYILDIVMNPALEVEKDYVNDMMNKKLSEKMMSINYANLENAYYLELRQSAIYSIETQDAIKNFVYTITNIVRKTGICIELLVIMITLSKPLILVILAINLIATLCYIGFKKYEKSFFDQLAKLHRRYSYYIGLCFDSTIQKDIRLYNMSRMLTDKVRTENKNILNFQKPYRKNKGNFNGMLSAFHIIQSIISYTYIVYRTFSGEINRRLSYGQFTFYINTTINAFHTLKELFFDIVSLFQLMKYLDPYIEFMTIKEEKDIFGTAVMDETVSSLEFINVSFSYPETETEVLSDVSFKILSTEKVSLVGLNGAGKSTIVKLLCRLYKPTGGYILINGIDIWAYNKDSYIKNITAVFQDYKIFALSILENITCKANGDDTKSISIMKEMGMEYLDTKYSNGIYTELDKSYEDEGIDLSGGEKQKLAIIRALYKGGSLFILDEPTSALDPRSEMEIYNQFQKLTNNKMAIYISHRMSSSTLCDKVLVLDHGRVVGFDSHKELIKNANSLYYKLFMAQAENYVN